MSEQITRRGARAETISSATLTGQARGQTQRAFWSLAQPIGDSRSYEQVLGTNYVRRLEHRFPDLLTGPPQRQVINLTAHDPQSVSTIMGEFIMGGGGIMGAGTVVSGDRVPRYINDDSGSIFVIRAGLSTQINPLTLEVVQTIELDQAATDAFIGQDGKGYVPVGAGVAMQRRHTITAVSHLYEDVQDALAADVEAVKGVTGGFRSFIIDPATNQALFTADGFLNNSGDFPIGPTDVPPNGMGVFGPYTWAGYDTGIFSFTPEGDVEGRLEDPLIGLRSSINGSRFAKQWGFHYTLTRRGVYQIGVGAYGQIGLERRIDFEGPVRGIPVAIVPIGEVLLVAYLNELGTTDIVRGEFNPAVTPTTGVPDWYAFDTLEGEEVTVLAATGLRSRPTVLAGTAGGKLYAWDLGRFNRDLSDPGYQQGLLTGEWYGSTMMLEPNRLAYPRSFRAQLANVDRGNYFELHTQVDDDLGGAGWLEFGGRLDTPGYFEVQPRNAGGDGFDRRQRFHNLAPRLTRTTTDTQAQLQGPLELEYVQLPGVVQERTWTLVLGPEPLADFAHLESVLDEHRGSVPVMITTPEGVERPGWVQALQAADLNGDAGGVQVEVTLW